MCLYPRLMDNPKYKPNKKNGGVIPRCNDSRVRTVAVGCGTCIECRNQNARGWQVRLQEDIKDNQNGRFITLTFNTESLKAINGKYEKVNKLKGYEKDNAIAAQAVRLYLERWRKEYKKSLRHWLVTELGGEHTEHIHLHGIVWTDKIKAIEDKWTYGYVWNGYETNGIIENYVNAKTVNYIIKYITKIDEKHLNYKPIILTSPGIGNRYTKYGDWKRNTYKGTETEECYKTNTGHKISMPIYWRNKIYTEEQREKLWTQKLDKGERWICGEQVNESEYYNVLEYHRRRTRELGYKDPEFIWKKRKYEMDRRRLIHEKRLK